jgi:hypothetical protein
MRFVNAFCQSVFASAFFYPQVFANAFFPRVIAFSLRDLLLPRVQCCEVREGLVDQARGEKLKAKLEAKLKAKAR